MDSKPSADSMYPGQPNPGAYPGYSAPPAQPPGYPAPPTGYPTQPPGYPAQGYPTQGYPAAQGYASSSPAPSLAYSTSQPGQPKRPPTPVKLVVAGGFGVGKTTTVGAISEIPPLTTEAAMTSVAAEIDKTGYVPNKTTTTVALDFGCITIDDEIKLYLFGTPGQDRFGFMWRDLTEGAIGALVIVDTNRLDDCYPAVDYFEQIKLPFVVGVNRFDGDVAHNLDDVRWALAISDTTPLVTFDARDRLSVRDALLEVLKHALARAAEARTG